VSKANCKSAAVDDRAILLRASPASVIVRSMRDWFVLIAHLIITTIRTVTPGGARAVIAESLILKHQLLILNRSRKKAPRLRTLDRIVRRILANHPLPKSGGGGPSWLSAIAEARDSLWSVDLIRCESILLKSFWVMVVMDVFSRRIIGFGVETGAYRRHPRLPHVQRGPVRSLPKRLSSDHDPLFRFHRWRANLRILNIEELKSVPFAPRSHPFVERLIGTLRRVSRSDLLLERRRRPSQAESIRHLLQPATRPCRTQWPTPVERCGTTAGHLNHFAWRSDCCGLFHTPIAV
jgi:putative transposase